MVGTILKALCGLAEALAILAGLGCLAAAVLAQGGRFNARLDALTHFAPFWAAGALLVLVFGLTLSSPRVRPWMLGIGGLGLLAAGALIAPELTRPMSPRAPANAPGQIKIIQLNGWESNRDIKSTARWLAAQHADIIVVEEAKPPLREAIRKATGYKMTIELSKAAIFHHAPTVPTAVPLGPPWKTWPSLVRASFEGPNGPYTVVGVHYVWPTWPLQALQRRRLAETLDHYERSRLIVVGDFNLTPWSFALRRQDARFGLERRTRAMFTWPAQPFANGRLTSPAPFLPIDHVYAGSGWRTVSITRGPRLPSDHYPVIVVLAPAT